MKITQTLLLAVVLAFLISPVKAEEETCIYKGMEPQFPLGIDAYLVTPFGKSYLGQWMIAESWYFAAANVTRGCGLLYVGCQTLPNYRGWMGTNPLATSLKCDNWIPAYPTPDYGLQWVHGYHVVDDGSGRDTSGGDLYPMTASANVVSGTVGALGDWKIEVDYAGFAVIDVEYNITAAPLSYNQQTAVANAVARKEKPVREFINGKLVAVRLGGVRIPIDEPQIPLQKKQAALAAIKLPVTPSSPIVNSAKKKVGKAWITKSGAKFSLHFQVGKETIVVPAKPVIRQVNGKSMTLGYTSTLKPTDKMKAAIPFPSR